MGLTSRICTTHAYSSQRLIFNDLTSGLVIWKLTLVINRYIKQNGAPVEEPVEDQLEAAVAAWP
jgi:hypothetical protein